jgi:hypothetical protein
MAQETVADLPVQYGYPVDVTTQAGQGEDLSAIWGRLNFIIGMASHQCIGTIFGIPHIWETNAVRRWIEQEGAALRQRIKRSQGSAFKRTLLELMLNEIDAKWVPEDAIKRDFLAELKAKSAKSQGGDQPAALAAGCLLYRHLDASEVQAFRAFAERAGVKDLQVLNEVMARICLETGLIDQALAYAGMALQPSGRIEHVIFGGVGFRESTAAKQRAATSACVSWLSRAFESWQSFTTLMENRVPLKILSVLPPGTIYMGKDASSAHLFFYNGAYRRLPSVRWVFGSIGLMTRLSRAPALTRPE